MARPHSGKAGLRIPLPREHGSWVMFFASYLTGTGTAALTAGEAGRSAAASLLFLVAGLAFFCLRRPLAALLRSQPGLSRREAAFWSAADAAVALLAGGMLLALGRWLLLPIGAAGAALLAVDLARAARSPRPTFASEAAGAVGLALAAPAAFYAHAGSLPAVALGAGVFLALHFLSGVFYIRMKARWLRQPPVTPEARLATAGDNAAYQVLALTAALLGARSGALPPPGWIALLPAVLRGLAGSIWGQRETDFKRLGWRETFYTAAALALWFAALATALY